jgi:Cu/Ag efflux pump CusA
VTGLFRSIIDISLRFRLLVIAIAAGIMVIGAALLPGMHTDVLPETSPVIVDVQTEALGLSGPEVESLVTVPLEKNLLEGVMGVTDVTSDSIPGLSAIELHFAPGTGLYQARQLVQERLTQAFVLPNVSKPPVMLQPVSSTSNVMIIGLTSNRLSAIDLSVLARWTIVPRLLGLAGVANVSTFGQADRQLQVLVDPAQLAAQHVTLAQIIDTAGNAQLVSPLSYLEASTPGTGGFLEGPNQRITIQHVLPFATPANLAQLPVADAPRGLLLGSVAHIVESHQPLIGDGQVRGGAGLVLVVQKLPSANVSAVTSEVDQALSALRPGLSGVRIDASLFRPATYLQSAFTNLRVALIIAMLLAALALIMLLLQLRLAFVGLTAITMSLVVATLVLYLFGYTFNALVTLGLLLALAVVVDEAAGQAHCLVARLRAGRTDGKRESVASLVAAACGELRGVLGGATLAVLLSVAPLFFAAGLTASFLRPMVVAFALAVTASMVVALTVTPALAMLLLAARRPEPQGTTLARRLGPGYARSLDWVRRAPFAGVLALCSVLGIAALVLLPFLHPGAPAFKDRSLVVHWTGAPGMSLTEMDRMTALASGELQGLPAVQDVGATLGRAVTSDQVVNTNSGEIWVTIKPSANYDQAVAAVRAIVAGTPGMDGVVSTYEGDSMASVLSSPPNVVTARVYGTSYPELEQLAGQVRTAMSHVSGVQHPQVQLPVEQPSVAVNINLDNAQLNGLSAGDIRRAAGTLLSGLTVGNFFQDQKVFDVVVWSEPSVRGSASDIGSLTLDTGNGGHTRLSDVAQIAVTADPADIQHEATSRYLDVTARVTGRGLGAVSTAIASRLGAIKFPQEYHAEMVSGASQGGTSRAEFIGYVVAALAGILLLAQAALRSWRLALVAFAALPVSLAGGVLTVFAIGAAGSLGAAAGLVAVFAIAARQSIGVTARISGRHATGGDSDAGLGARMIADNAGQIGVSAVVTAAALLPFIVIGDVAGAELLHTAAAVILGGLITTTLVSLFVLPAACLRLGPVAAVSRGEYEPRGQEPGGPDRASPSPAVHLPETVRS